MGKYKRSAVRKGINSSLVWARTLDPKRQYYTYNALAGVDALYGLLMCLAHMNKIREYFPSRIAKEIEKYYKINDGSNKPIIDDTYCYRLPGPEPDSLSNKFKGTAKVKSISKGEVVIHAIEFSNVAHSSAPKKKKEEAVIFGGFSCDCNYCHWALNLTAPTYERKSIGDFRLYDDIPGPEVGVVYCKDINALIHLEVEKKGWESYGFWGLEGQVMEFLKFDIEKVLRTKRKDSTRLSKYRVNNHLLLRTRFFEPLEEWIRKIQTSPS